MVSGSNFPRCILFQVGAMTVRAVPSNLGLPERDSSS
uniref:Uncharacterized protein n=1 Tax=Rhizophora mucronata TaxID=61149 RepID=A0A2P2QB33_RHIMU